MAAKACCMAASVCTSSAATFTLGGYMPATTHAEEQSDSLNCAYSHPDTLWFTLTTSDNTGLCSARGKRTRRAVGTCFTA